MRPNLNLRTQTSEDPRQIRKVDINVIISKSPYTKADEVKRISETDSHLEDKSPAKENMVDISQS